MNLAPIFAAGFIERRLWRTLDRVGWMGSSKRTSRFGEDHPIPKRIRIG